MGNGKQYVIFDCKYPTYINSDNISIRSNLLKKEIDRFSKSTKNSKAKYICDKTSDLWKIVPSKRNEKGGLLSIDESIKAKISIKILADINQVREILGEQGSLFNNEFIINLVKDVTHHKKQIRRMPS